MHPVIFTNSDIKGATVRSRVNRETYVFDPSKPADFRRTEVSQGHYGVLNGNIIVLLKNNESEEPYRKLASESHALRDLLTSSEALKALNIPPFQRNQGNAKLFHGSRMLLGINWEFWDESRECAHLISWLELITS